jgi:hypothetical protein
VEYQQIKYFFGMAFVAGVLVLVRWLVPALVGMGCWERSGVLVVGLCLVHCWVLRQQDLFAAMRGTVVSLFPATGCCRTGWPALLGWVCVVVVVDGVVV